MENEDDTFVVIIGDDDDDDDNNWESGSQQIEQLQIKQEVKDDLELDADASVENILELASKVGEFIELDQIEETNIKSEPEYLDTEYLGDEIDPDQPEGEIMNFEDEYILPDEDFIPSDLEMNESDFHTDSDSGSKRRKAEFRKSFVEDLRNEYPELRGNDTQLIKILVTIMKSVKRPPPPRDYFVMNAAMLECVKCGAFSESEPAAWRHWQEKHGKRYLVCYACGVDFRSCTNLYKHEKRCSAKDANIVLKARAIFLGRKGRSRPFLGLAKKYFKKKSASGYTKKTFPCTICSAVFNSKNNLQSHENLHRGLRPYRCKQCICAYTSVSALARHAQKHKNEKFICDHCQRAFNSKPTLIAHLDTHSQVRKFGCSLCPKRYAQRAALKLHVARVHLHLPPPCACQICPKRYPRMSLLKQHMKQEHGMTLMTRKMFFKMLPTLTDTQLQQAILVLKSDAPFVKTESVLGPDPDPDPDASGRLGMNEADIVEFPDAAACVDLFPDLKRHIVYRTKC